MPRGVMLRDFGARDMVSRWDGWRCIIRFPDSSLNRVPFPVSVLQVDGGSEFTAKLEEACR
jgi:hypothetical protein